MKRIAFTLTSVLLALSFSGCSYVAATPETTAAMSDTYLCGLLGPKWFSTAEEKRVIGNELNRRGVICDYGRIVGYKDLTPKPAPFQPEQPQPTHSTGADQYAGQNSTNVESQPSISISTGSGFFVSEDGYFVTNHHVIAGAEAIVLMDINSKKYDAEVIRVDEANDIAVLKVKGNFKALPVISSRSAKRGTDVVTVGYPHADIQGVEPKVTQGIINSLSGINNDARTFQVSVPLQSGNSGGPLVTMDGNVIGVVAMKLSAIAVLKETGDLPQNVNYAIKSNYLTEVLLGIPGMERKLIPPSNKAFKNVAELTAAIEGSTALVVASIPGAEAQREIPERTEEGRIYKKIAVQTFDSTIMNRVRTDAKHDDDQICNLAKRLIEEQRNVIGNLVLGCINRKMAVSGEVKPAEQRLLLRSAIAGIPNLQMIVLYEVGLKNNSDNWDVSSDSNLNEQIRRRLGLSGLSQDSTTSMLVFNYKGAVYLMGLVTREEGDTAAQVAARTPGVTKVTKLFEYIN